MPQSKKIQDETCYHFTLKCLAGLATAASVALGVIVAAATSSTTVAAVATTALVTSALVTSSFLPTGLGISGVLLVIGSICLLPCLFCRSNRLTHYVTTTPNAGGWCSLPFWSSPTFNHNYSGYQPSYRPVVNIGAYPSHQHGHSPTEGGGFFHSHQHTHSDHVREHQHHHGHQH